MKRVGDAVTQIDHDRTRAHAYSAQMIKSRTHTRGMPKHSVARGREDSRTQGLRAGARENGNACLDNKMYPKSYPIRFKIIIIV